MGILSKCIENLTVKSNFTVGEKRYEALIVENTLMQDKNNNWFLVTETVCAECFELIEGTPRPIASGSIGYALYRCVKEPLLTAEFIEGESYNTDINDHCMSVHDKVGNRIQMNHVYKEHFEFDEV